MQFYQSPIIQEENQVKATNMLCECNPKYFADCECLLKQISRNVSTVNFSGKLLIEFAELTVNKRN